MVQQKIAQILGTGMADFEADGRSVSAGLELTFECTHQIIHFFVVDIEVTVAGDTKLVAALNGHSRKQIVDMCMDHRRQEHIVVAAGFCEFVR